MPKQHTEHPVYVTTKQYLNVLDYLLPKQHTEHPVHVTTEQYLNVLDYLMPKQHTEHPVYVTTELYSKHSCLFHSDQLSIFPKCHLSLSIFCRKQLGRIAGSKSDCFY